MTDMSAFLAALTPEQRAALASVPAPTPSPKAAKAKAKAATGQAKPAPLPSDDEDDSETVPETVAAVGAKLKANGSTLPIKASNGAMIGPDTFGRSLPVSVLPTMLTLTFPDGSSQRFPFTPKVFSTGSIGVNASGKALIDSPDGRSLQVNVNLTYIKPKTEK